MLQKILVFFLTFAALVSAEWKETGMARCSGLFLLNKSNASANVFGCQILDSVRTSVLDVDAKLRDYNAKASWMYNGWKIKPEWTVPEAEIGTRGKFRHLVLEASVAGNGEHLRGLAESAIQTADSLAYIGTRFGGGSVGTITAKWTMLHPNGMLDTMDLEYETRYRTKGVFIGSKIFNHTAEVNWDFFHTRRAPFDDVHYAIRDSSEGFLGRFHYGYHASEGTFQFLAFWAHLNSEFFLLRSEEDNVKRFGYLELKGNLEGANLSYENRKWDLQAGAFFLQLEVPRHAEKFFETLAPNRALDYSLLQVLSSSFYKINYRMYGDLSGFLSHVKIKRTFEFTPGEFHLHPAIGADFFYVQGELDGAQENVTTSFIFSKVSKKTFEGNLKTFGVIANIAFAIESPKRRFFLNANAYQIAPIALFKELNKTDADGNESSISLGGESPSKSKTEYLPFKTGFAFDASFGIRF